MNLDRKISLRFYFFVGASFVVLALLVGIGQAITVLIGGYFMWKAREIFLLKQYWKKETAFDKSMAEFIASQLREGADSRNVFIASLADPELRSVSRDYTVELLAR